MAAVALNAALIKRVRSGHRVCVGIGMFETLAAYTLVEHRSGTAFVPPEDVAGCSRVISPERKPFATRDDHLCMLAHTDPQWLNFQALEAQPGVADEPCFATMSERTQNIDVLYAVAGAVLATRTTAESLVQLTAIEIPCARVNTFDDLRHDRHLTAIGFQRRLEHPSESSIEVSGPAPRIDGDALHARRQYACTAHDADAAD